MDEITLTGALPTMNVEITHHTAPDGSAEHLTIHLTATPNFQSALPLAGGLAQMPFMLGGLQSPLAAWTQAAQALMAPWANLAQLNPLANLAQLNPLANLAQLNPLANLAQVNPWTALLTDGFLGKREK